ncbi:hypothetical protein ACTWP4_16870 [Gracilibacillus sp. D59]|uniref:hypothetical protein n=1 Tax=Gracilibacillus sp. D59 TaxID=3457434 RepID=UPI003FCEC257
MKKRLLIVVIIPLLVLLIFGLTYIPYKVVNWEPSNVSKITVFNGNTGSELEIIDQTEIEYIINNLSDVTFQKGKPSFGYTGYSFRTTIYNDNGKAIDELIVNSNEVIRYKGFFYTAKDNSIDYNYLESLFDN